jgi:hypothetical protein
MPAIVRISLPMDHPWTELRFLLAPPSLHLEVWRAPDGEETALDRLNQIIIGL